MQRLASCGGAYSNHLHALAWAGMQLGMSTSAIVRGEELMDAWNPTLRDLREWGMQLSFVSRERYRALRQSGWALLMDADTLNIPEGGDNFLGVLGCLSMAQTLSALDYSQVHVACGTGCTFLGLRLGLPARVEVSGYSMLKGAWQQRAMQTRLSMWNSGAPAGPWTLHVETGRFGQREQQVAAFMAEFAEETGVALDPIYTGPMMWRFCKRLANGDFTAGSRLLVLHSGGLQGAREGLQSILSNAGEEC